jgi:Tol biopolymer transport system component
MTRVTAEGRNSRAIWAPDGRHVTFASSTAGPEQVVSMAANGSGTAEPMPAFGEPSSWSPDGRVLAFLRTGGSTDGPNSVGLLFAGASESHRLTTSRFTEAYPEFSPDGRWIAYTSNETSRPEVYAQAYPGPGERQQISNNGGTQPAWAGNGREIFYTEIDAKTQRTRMMSVPATPGAQLAAGLPRVLFEGTFRSQANTRGYDVTPDGRRFLMVKPKPRPPSPVTQLVLVLNWFEELKAKVPAGGAK